MNDRYDKRIGGAVALSYTALVLINIYNVVAPEFGLSREVVSLGIKIVMLWVFIKCIPIILKRVSIGHIGFCLVAVFTCCLNILLFPQTNQYFISTMIDFISMPFIVTILLLSCRNYKCLISMLSVCSKISSGLILFIDIFYLSNINSSNYRLSYFMGLSNALILPTILLMYDMISKKAVMKMAIDVFLILGNMIFILIKGSRGALLAIVIGCIIIFFKNKGGKIITYILSGFAICVATLWKEILMCIAYVLKERGIAARTLNLLLTNATYSSSRDKLQAKLIDEIVRRPFSIRGINADYLVNEIYAHNLFLELLYDFGIVFGGVISIIILWLSVKTIFMQLKCEKNIILLILFLSFFPLLMVSSSCFINISFWPWLVICLDEHMKSKRIRIKWGDKIG